MARAGPSKEPRSRPDPARLGMTRINQREWKRPDTGSGDWYPKRNLKCPLAHRPSTRHTPIPLMQGRPRTRPARGSRTAAASHGYKSQLSARSGPGPGGHESTDIRMECSASVARSPSRRTAGVHRKVCLWLESRVNRRFKLVSHGLPLTWILRGY